MANPAYVWTGIFSVPLDPTNLVIVTDDDTAALVATVSPSVDPYHEAYVWEAQSTEGWIEVGRTFDPTFTYRKPSLNTDIGLRVRDYNGGLYSDAVEGAGRVNDILWWMNHVDGNPDFITQLRYVRGLGSVDDPLDQTILQPLSSDAGDYQFPIVITGQRQGERLSLTMDVRPEDADLIRKLQRAAREPAGKIILQSPTGDVYAVALGGLKWNAGVEAWRTVEVSATRVA